MSANSRLLFVLVTAAFTFRAQATDKADRLTSQPQTRTHTSARLPVGEKITASARQRYALPGGARLFVNAGTQLRQDSDFELSVFAGEIFLVHGDKGKSEPFLIKTPKREVRAPDSSFAVRVDSKGTGVVVARGQARLGELAVRAGQQVDADAAQPTEARRLSHVLDWTREMLSASEAPLVPASEHAGGALLAVDPHGQEAKLELRKFHVDVFIEDGFARTTVDQTYFNHDPWQMEGTFYFPLPPDASLSRLAMYVNGQLMEGGMAERDYARVIYESIRYMRRDPALLEWVDGSTFKMRVFPIEGRQEKRIILSYTQRLPSLYGKLTYRFPAGHSLQMVGDWSFSARVKNAPDITWTSSTHKLQEQKRRTSKPIVTSRCH